MKPETLVTIALGAVAIYYIFRERKQETQQEGMQQRAAALTTKSMDRNRERWGDASGHVFDWIDYRMMGGGATINPGKQAL